METDLLSGHNFQIALDVIHRFSHYLNIRPYNLLDPLEKAQFLKFKFILYVSYIIFQLIYKIIVPNKFYFHF